MRGTRAKALRKLARQHSKPTKYHGEWYKAFLGKTHKDGKPAASLIARGTLVCTGYRHVYKEMKKLYLAGRQQNDVSKRKARLDRADKRRAVLQRRMAQGNEALRRAQGS